MSMALEPMDEGVGPTLLKIVSGVLWLHT